MILVKEYFERLWITLWIVEAKYVETSVVIEWEPDLWQAILNGLTCLIHVVSLIFWSWTSSPVKLAYLPQLTRWSVKYFDLEQVLQYL